MTKNFRVCSNIEGGASTISNGHWDGLTVFDFDADGSAEVAIKTANGFVFGDGTTLRHTNDQVGDWNLEARSRNTYSWRRTFEGLVQARGAIPFYGDIFGDWREEAVLETSDLSELRIYATTYETDIRLYTLVKQSHLVDYFLGHGMAPPPAPKILLVARP